MKAKHLLQRKDGSEVKIVAREFYGAGLTRSVGVDVFHRQSSKQTWVLAGDRPHPNWRGMSVQEYIKHGRPEMLKFASAAEILRVVSVLEDTPANQEAEADSPLNLESPQG